jgi:NADH dehydrogenase
VNRIVLLSFLHARPNCGSPYHESKWEAEEQVRSSGIPYTILKAGMIYGRGDHMLDHMSHSFHSFPFFPTVGFREKPIAPLPVEELVAVLKRSLLTDDLVNKTIPITGAESLLLSEAARRIASVLGKRLLVLPAPLWLNYVFGWFFERSMKIPLVAIAQVRILSEGVTLPEDHEHLLPEELRPKIGFSETQIQKSLPPPGSFTLHDFECSTWRWLTAAARE